MPKLIMIAFAAYLAFLALSNAAGSAVEAVADAKAQHHVEIQRIVDGE